MAERWRHQLHDQSVVVDECAVARRRASGGEVVNVMGVEERWQLGRANIDRRAGGGGWGRRSYRRSGACKMMSGATKGVFGEERGGGHRRTAKFHGAVTCLR